MRSFKMKKETIKKIRKLKKDNAHYCMKKKEICENLVGWWENDLTYEDRTMLMKEINYESWEGTTEERHEKLVEMYKVWYKK